MGMHIGHLALRVTDADAYAEFAAGAIGLTETDRDEVRILMSAGEKHHELELIRGEQNGLDHVGLEVESEAELARITSSVEAAGITCTEVPTELSTGLEDAVRFTGPGGLAYEVYTGMLRSSVSFPRYTRRHVRRLGHLTFVSAEHAAVERFWIEALGFRVSDRLGPVTWLRCDTDHHGFSVAPRPQGTALHHHAWQTQDLGTMASYCDQLAVKRLRLHWGPVRHGPGFNLATYLPDPTGGLLEVYADLLQIVDDKGYVAHNWDDEAEHALNLWGPPPPGDFLERGTPTLGFVAAD
jgi:catechol-2,3-dioxygenase